MSKQITPEMTGFDSGDPDRFIPYRPRLLRIADSVVYALDRGRGRRIMALDEEKLIREARRRTGLSDFGDESFREPLRILCEHSRTGGPMTFVGRKMLHDELLNRLMNKLKIQAIITSHPEILDQKIEKPVFILGLPRTGTTVLYRLLSKNVDLRAPLTWELNEPVPPPEPSVRVSDPRIKKCQKQFNMMNYINPALKAIHEVEADLPEECFLFMANDLHSTQFTLFWESPYLEWLMNQDMTHIYKSHKRQLQLLQWKFDDKRWVLKWPGHMYWLKELLHVYPDARIVQTHRDPIKVMASISSLLTTARMPTYDDMDPKRIGMEALDLFSSFATRADLARREEEQREGSTALFHDVYFTDFIKDQMSAIREIHDAFGMELTERSYKNMAQYLDERPRYKYGKHSYTLEQFGLSEKIVRARFHKYYERFGL